MTAEDDGRRHLRIGKTAQVRAVEVIGEVHRTPRQFLVQRDRRIIQYDIRGSAGREDLRPEKRDGWPRRSGRFAFR